ncbi:twin-arginine translocase TatA/TatE family subunit [Kallotenue papyrolyticum]|uniref:twin-arginine translocase TatA/TatE family subunit n=1 Tax=Kallotenue papyrolyticum TaxID=1325125 RepID=UPI00047861B0|nr:twin-arginine translocase TatA/TatE family subunit [Kallotenue papyrolyticum]
MFGVGVTELVIILIIALLVVGPERLPELAAQAGRLVRDLRRMYANLRAELGPEFDDIERTIHELRALDPRRQISSYGRDLLDELARDAPEIKQLSAPRRIELEQLTREVLDDDLLARPLAETRAEAAGAPTAFAVPRGGTAGARTLHAAEAPAANGAGAAHASDAAATGGIAEEERMTQTSTPATEQPQPARAARTEQSWHYE